MKLSSRTAGFKLVELMFTVVLIGVGAVMQHRGAAIARGFYMRAITPYALLVLVIVVLTSFLMR